MMHLIYRWVDRRQVMIGIVHAVFRSRDKIGESGKEGGLFSPNIRIGIFMYVRSR
jgi:hypothetical protein